MVISLVEDAVEIKLHFENFSGILQSNYECSYALGKMMKILKMPELSELTSEELEKNREIITKKLEDYTARDYVEENLMKLIREYRIQQQEGEELLILYKKGYEK